MARKKAYTEKDVIERATELCCGQAGEILTEYNYSVFYSSGKMTLKLVPLYTSLVTSISPL